MIYPNLLTYIYDEKFREFFAVKSDTIESHGVCVKVGKFVTQVRHFLLLNYFLHMYD